MKLFIDTANSGEIRTAAQWGIVDGVTTNPSLVAKESVGDLKQAILAICAMVDGPISVEVMNIDSADKLLAEARDVASWHKNIVIKVPCTFEGLKAVKILAQEKIPTNVTLVFSPNQVLLAAKAGATYISPFVGRLDDSGEDGMGMIAESLQIINAQHFASKIIVASIRSPLTIQRAASMGAHIATVPYKLLEQMIQHPLTAAGIKKFTDDWNKK